MTTNQFIYKKFPTIRCAILCRSPRPSSIRSARWPIPRPELKSLTDVVARAKADPGGLNYGSFGIGNQTHQMGVLLSGLPRTSR